MNSLKELAEKVATLEKELAEIKASRVVEHHHHHYPAPVSYPIYVYPSYQPYYPPQPWYGSSVLCSGGNLQGGSGLGNCNTTRADGSCVTLTN